MATESVTTEVTTGGDFGIYGLLSGFRVLRIDREKDVVRVFTDMSTTRLEETANRADNTVEGASGALHTIGDLLMAHNKTCAQVDSLSVGATVTMLVDLLDGARMIASDARYELELRKRGNEVVA